MIDIIANAPIDFTKTYVVGEPTFYMSATFLKDFRGRPRFNSSLGYRIICSFFYNEVCVYKLQLCLQGLFLDHVEIRSTTDISRLTPNSITDIPRCYNKLIDHLKLDYDYITYVKSFK